MRTAGGCALVYVLARCGVHAAAAVPWLFAIDRSLQPPQLKLFNGPQHQGLSDGGIPACVSVGSCHDGSWAVFWAGGFGISRCRFLCWQSLADVLWDCMGLRMCACRLPGLHFLLACSGCICMSPVWVAFTYLLCAAAGDRLLFPQCQRMGLR